MYDYTNADAMVAFTTIVSYCAVLMASTIRRKTMASTTTQPIKSRVDVERLKNFYLTSDKPSIRNYAMIAFGLNSALRISDIIKLKWKDVYDFEAGCFLDRVEVTEQKTKKHKDFPLNGSIHEALSRLFDETDTPAPNDWVFASQMKGPLSRAQAYRIVTHAANELSLGRHISCHSLRKTFGYHAYKMGVSPALLMELYNHSSYQVTRRYLCLGQDERDEVYMKLNL